MELKFIWVAAMILSGIHGPTPDMSKQMYISEYECEQFINKVSNIFIVLSSKCVKLPILVQGGSKN